MQIRQIRGSRVADFATADRGTGRGGATTWRNDLARK